MVVNEMAPENVVRVWSVWKKMSQHRSLLLASTWRGVRYRTWPDDLFRLREHLHGCLARSWAIIRVRTVFPPAFASFALPYVVSLSLLSRGGKKGNSKSTEILVN